MINHTVDVIRVQRSFAVLGQEREVTPENQIYIPWDKAFVMNATEGFDFNVARG